MHRLFFKRLIGYNLVYPFIFNKKQTFLIKIYPTFCIKSLKRETTQLPHCLDQCRDGIALNHMEGVILVEQELCVEDR